MAAITSPGRTGPRSGPQSRNASIRLIGPWQNALEGAAAALCAVAAMAAVSALALALLDAESVGSLWSLTPALTAMAVGGSVSAGPDVPADSGSMGGPASLFGGGGGMGPSMSGAADVVPLGVTLVGAVVLWIAFSRRLRAGQQRRFTGGELGVRAAGAATAALVTLMIVAAVAQGSASMPEAAMNGMGAGGGGASGGLGELLGGGGGDGLGGLLGGGGTGARPEMAYRVSARSAGLGAVLWVAVVLGAGCLVSRRVRLPLGGTLDGLRAAWGPSLSAVVRMTLVFAAVPLVALTVAGAVAGGRAGSAAGAALLLAPNAVAVFLTLGVGSSWTAEVHPVRSDGDGNPLAALMGGMGGGQQPDRTEQLRSLSAGGWPLWLVALAVTCLALLVCAYRAARVTSPGRVSLLLPCRGPLGGHIGMAGRFGVVTAVVLGGATWLAEASGHVGVSMFGSEMGGMQAELSGSLLRTTTFALLAGAVTGFAGSLLAAAHGSRATR
ncbi:streptophobe family protein [Streptomyces sp. NPDC002285]